MDLEPLPKIVSAQRAHNGVIIEFDDGKAAFYSASLLAEVFPRAVKIEELEAEGD